MNVIIHNLTNEKYENVKRKSLYFFENKLKRYSLKEQMKFELWVNETNKAEEMYECKVKLNPDFNGEYFVNKRGRTLSEALRKASLAVKKTFSSIH